MLKRLHSRLWIRPQMFFTAWILASELCDLEIPRVILNKKGAAAIAIGIADFILCEIVFEILGTGDRWEDTKRCKTIEEYIETKGFSGANISSADKYYFLKKFIEKSKDHINKTDLDDKMVEVYKDQIKKAEGQLEEIYEEALILELAEVEKG